MRPILTWVTLFAFTAARADGLQVLPKWHLVGDEACYSFEDAKRLFELDGKLVACVTEEETVSLLLEANDHLTIANDKLTLAVQKSEEARTKVVADLKTCIDEKHKAMADSGASVAWPILAGVGLFIAGAATGYLLLHN